MVSGFLQHLPDIVATVALLALIIVSAILPRSEDLLKVLTTPRDWLDLTVDVMAVPLEEGDLPGVVYGIVLQHRNVGWPIAVSSVVFVLAHLHVSLDPSYLVRILAWAVILGVVRAWVGGIAGPVVVHSAGNLLAGVQQ